jgi:alpha-tubulin suppressor-like RCC1 family protein
VSCWGYGPDGELGNGGSANASSPVAVTGLSGAAQKLGAGWYHTCAIATDGSVQCWGMGTSGQLGNGNTASSALPVRVLGLAGATQVTGGQSHTCALAGGQVWCWGDETNGALGNGVSGGTAAVPVQVQQLF